MFRGRERRAASVGAWLFAVTVPTSALVLGSLQPTPLVVVSVMAALAAGLLWLEPPGRLSTSARWLLAVWALLTGMTLLQLVPLPAELVRALAPSNAEIWERSLAPFKEAPPAWHPLTLAPAATRMELLRGIFYGCLFLSALRLGAEEGGTTFLERIVMASASLLAIVSLAHAAVDAQKVFGIYRPRELYAFMPGRYGPLLNVNHLTAYLNAGACVALGTFLRGTPAVPKPLALACAILLAGTSVWAASRGGTGALLIGIVLTVALSIQARRTLRSVRAEVAVPIGVIVAAAAMIGLGLSEEARDDLANRDVSKVAVAINALRLVPRSPVFGVGRGAFEGVFPWVRETTDYFTFTNPENIVAQWSTEWGAPVALAGACGIAWALRPSQLLAASRPVVGGWVALVIVAVHDLVDFHLEVPGVVALMCVIAGAVTGSRSAGRSSRERSSSKPERHPRYRALAFGCAIAVVPAAALVLPTATHLIAEDRLRLSKAANDPETTRAAFRDDLRATMRRYPAEAFFPLMGAVRAQVFGDEPVIPWIGRALEMNPRFGRAHLVLGRSLARRYRAQARLEYRLAYEYDSGLREAILKEVPPLVDDFDDALELVPSGADGVAVLDHLATALAGRLPSSAVRLDEELSSRQPDSPGVLRRRVEGALSDVKHAHAWCVSKTACVQEAVASAKALIARERGRCEGYLLLAKVRVASADPIVAFDELEPALDSITVDAAECQRGLVQLAVETNQPRRADIAMERILRGGCGAAEECVDLYSWAAGVEEQRGKGAAAIVLYKRALDLRPDRADLLERVGALAASIGLHVEAMNAYSVLASRFPDEPRWAEGLANARQGIARRGPPNP